MGNILMSLLPLAIVTAIGLTLVYVIVKSASFLMSKWKKK